MSVFSIRHALIVWDQEFSICWATPSFGHGPFLKTPLFYHAPFWPRPFLTTPFWPRLFLTPPLPTPSPLNPTSVSKPSINSNKINFHMKYKGKRTSGPPPRARTSPKKKKSFRRWGLWVISYRSSHKRARSVNAMEVVAMTDGQTL